MIPNPHRVALCGPCTLDGQPAEVRAPLQSEATVQTLDPTGPAIRLPWNVVAASRHRAFFAPKSWRERAVEQLDALTSIHSIPDHTGGIDHSPQTMWRNPVGVA